MIVNVTHSQKGKNYFVSVTVQFSETEQATIKARHLQKNWIDISPGVLASSVVPIPPIAVGTIRSIGRILMIGGFIYGLVYSTNLWGFIFVAGVAMELYGWYLERKLNKGEKDSVFVKDLLSGPLVILAANPVIAKEADLAIRNSLTSLKSFLDESETLGAKDTFEL
jgi:hypothetical protein